MNQREETAYIRSQITNYLAIQHGIKNPLKAFHCLSSDHNDENASMILNKKNPAKVHCFGCGVSWDIFDLVGNDYKLESFPERKKKACEVLGLNLESISENDYLKAISKTEQPTKQPEDLSSYFNNCAADIEKAADYLNDRGISIETAKRFNIGYDAFMFPFLWAGDTSAEQIIEMRNEGISGERRFNQKKPALIIPTTKGSFTARYLEASGDDQRYFIRGQSELFNYESINTDDFIFIVEGPLDALSFEELGYKAISLNGVNNSRKLVERLKKEKKLNSCIIIALDNDDAGQRTSTQLSEDLTAAKIKNFEAAGIYSKYKDANEYLQADRLRFNAQIKGTLDGLKTRLDDEKMMQQEEYYNQYQAAAYLKEFEAIMNSQERRNIETGFRLFDEALDGGIYPEFYIIGAGSSVGKSAYCLQLADQIAKRGHDILFFCLEMSKAEMIARSISRQTAIYCNYQRKPFDMYASYTGTILSRERRERCNDTQRLFIDNAIKEYQQKQAQRIYFIESAGDLSVADIRDAVRRHIDITGRKPVIFIDYLQIIQPASNKMMTDKQQIDLNVSELKRISRDYAAPVIAISSFNRASYRNRADLDSFKESGGIEYSADVLLALQFKDQNEKTDIQTEKEKDIRDLQLVVLKNRNGKSYKKINLTYYAPFHYFIESPENHN